jgi:hypothetical protein
VFTPARPTRARRDDLPAQEFEIKEMMNDLVARVEERAAAEAPQRDDGLDERNGEKKAKKEKK